ncbi:hypothetical protein PSHT_04900, partial [Puccinia striiformis]
MAKNLKRASNGRDPQVVTKIIGGRLSPPGDPFNAEYQEESGFCQDTVWFRRPYKTELLTNGDVVFTQTELHGQPEPKLQLKLDNTAHPSILFYSTSKAQQLHQSRRTRRSFHSLNCPGICGLLEFTSCSIRFEPPSNSTLCIHIIIRSISFSGFCRSTLRCVTGAYQSSILTSNSWNFDPLGIHTGDSIVIAPYQTLSDTDYQMIGTTAINIICHLRVVGLSMKLVGEVMAIGENFEEATQKAIWSVDPSFTGFNKNHISRLPEEYLLLPMPAPILFDRLLQN